MRLVYGVFIFLSTCFMVMGGYAEGMHNFQAYIQTDRVVFNYQDEIPLQLSILNKGEAVNIQVSQKNPVLNYVVEVHTKEGYSVPEKDSFYVARFNMVETIRKQRVKGISNHFQSVMLAENEMKGYEVNLSSMYDLLPGQYLVRFKFYPSTLIESPASAVYSPFIQIIVNKKINNTQAEAQSDIEAMENEQWDKKSVEEILHEYYTAKQNKDWARMFYVLDLKTLIGIYAEFGYTYSIAKEQDKTFILEDFKKYLQDLNEAERVISYEVEEMDIRKRQAIAKVVVTVDAQGAEISREYRIKLSKKYYWKIESYSVVEKQV